MQVAGHEVLQLGVALFASASLSSKRQAVGLRGRKFHGMVRVSPGVRDPDIPASMPKDQ
jgi:hypothetical protein